MPARVRGDPGRDLIDLGWLIDQFAAPAKAPDRRQLGLAGGFGHDRDKGQAQKIGEIGLGDGGRTRRGFDQRGAAPDAAVADAVKKQRPRQPVLEAAGRMRAFILEIDRDIGQALKRRLDQMRVRRAVAVTLENGDGIAGPYQVHLLGRGEFGDAKGHIVWHGPVSGDELIGSVLTRRLVKRPGVGVGSGQGWRVVRCSQFLQFMENAQAGAGWGLFGKAAAGFDAPPRKDPDLTPKGGA